ncbi:MAG: Rne/Rng family ribonuclease [Flavobacteriales bacterium]
MKYELLVDSRPSEVVIALLKDKQLIELHKEPVGTKFSVGDIFLAKVKKIINGLNATFVDVGHEKDGFLHYLDLGAKFKTFQKFTERNLNGKLNTASLRNFKHEPELEKSGTINEVLQSGNQIMVQVVKEPISTKGPRLTAELTIAGRYMVLVPFSNKVSVSQKIESNEEKKRLKKLVQSIKPPGFGVIIRTVAQGKMVAELDGDLKFLYKKWQKLYKQTKKVNPPSKVLGELGRTASLLRDVLNDDFATILVNDEKLHSEIKDYISTISPDQEKIVKLYKGTIPLFQKYAVERQIKSAFGKTVTMRKSTYLVIEHTEAMHVIDVNSGKRVNSKQDQESNALEVNLIAAEEVARQLRLRDMGGIIVVDFIDMYNGENRKKLFDSLKTFMADDKAKHHILPPSRFGLIEITRQRVRPELNIETKEGCPACKGTGKIEASILLIDEIGQKLAKAIDKSDNIILKTHPFVASYISKGFFKNQRRSWAKEYGCKLKVEEDTTYHLLQYRFFNKDRKVIPV